MAAANSSAPSLLVLLVCGAAERVWAVRPERPKPPCRMSSPQAGMPFARDFSLFGNRAAGFPLRRINQSIQYYSSPSLQEFSGMARYCRIRREAENVTIAGWPPARRFRCSQMIRGSRRLGQVLPIGNPADYSATFGFRKGLPELDLALRAQGQPTHNPLDLSILQMSTQGDLAFFLLIVQGRRGGAFPRRGARISLGYAPRGTTAICRGRGNRRVKISAVSASPASSASSIARPDRIGGHGIALDQRGQMIVGCIDI